MGQLTIQNIEYNNDNTFIINDTDYYGFYNLSEYENIRLKQLKKNVL